jgi:hypothetical protein
MRIAMRMRDEEEPEPDEEPEPGEEPVAPPPGSSLVPTVPGGAGREFEYRTELVSQAELADGKTLPERLTRASADGWDLVDIIQAGDQHVILLRQPKKAPREARPVGFMLPNRSQ